MMTATAIQGRSATQHVEVSRSCGGTVRRLGAAALAWAASALVSLAAAETSQVSAAGFVVQHREALQATPDEIWQAMTQLPRWWSDAHTWSGKAANMSLELDAGGCWCERWGERNAARHGVVVMVQPGRLLRLDASLGPLQDMPVRGVLTLVTGMSEGKAILRMTYRVAGNADAGLDKLAAPVDQVMGEQFRRLKQLAQTGRPD